MISQASIKTGFEESNEFKRNLMIGLSALYYFFNTSKAKKESFLFHANPRLEEALVS